MLYYINMITPQEAYPELAKALGISSILFKREDLHPYGSHKGRSIPVMIDTYIEQGIRHFVLSSSGNSALAGALHVQKINQARPQDDQITIEIFAGKNIKPTKLAKLEKLKDQNILVSVQDRPLQAVFMKVQDPKIKGLRQSSDDIALVGYRALAEELLEITNLKAVFMGTSSGTTAQALAQFFIEHDKKIEVHIVQIPACHPIAEAFVDDDASEERSIADAIIDHTALRKEALVPLLEKTGGSGWIARNEQIAIAQELAQKNTGVSISPNSALSVAGVMEASYTGREWDGDVVCLICGE